LRLYLGRYPDEWCPVGEVDSADLAPLGQRIDECGPDILILFCQTAGDLLQMILSDVSARYPRVRILVSGVQPESSPLVQGWGADAVLLTTETPPTLLTRLRVLRFDREE
jgi:hypothetical protein